MNRSAVVMVLGLALLGGCATSGTESPDRWVFDKPGVADAQRSRDKSECFSESVDAETAKPGLMKVDRRAYRTCMEGRGYVLRTGPR